VAEGSFSYETAITDGMSAPARAEGDALKRLQGEIKSTETAIRALQTEQLNYQRGGFKGAAADIGLEIRKLRLPLGDLKGQFRDLKDEQKEKAEGGFFSQLTGSLIPQIALGELAAEGVKKIAETFYDVAKGIGEATVEAGKFAVEMAEARENSISAYEAVFESKQAAELAFDAFETVGKAAHLPVDRAQAIAQDLMLQGEEHVDIIAGVLTASADLTRVGLAAGAEKFKSIVERSLTAGAFVLPKKLAGLGVQLPDLYADLAARLHTSVANVKAELKAGKIDAEVGIQALTDAITSGKVGEAASKKLTFGDIVTDFKNDLVQLVEGVNFQPLLTAFSDITYLVEGADGDTGDLKTTIQGAFNAAINLTGEAVDAVIGFGLEVEILGLKAELFWKKHRKGVDDLIEGVKDLGITIEHLLGVGTGEFDFEKKGREAIQNFGRSALDSAKGFLGIGGETPTQAPAHAAGGMVAEPAAGEYFASVKPGERIVPAGRATDDVAGLSLPDFSHVASMGGGGGNHVHPGAIHVEIHVPGGTTATANEMQEITEHAMYDVLERIVAELGG
jgi:hypothetical protein